MNFEKNLKALEKKEPELAEILRNTPDAPNIRSIDDGIEISFLNGEKIVFERKAEGEKVRNISGKGKLFRFSEIVVLVGAGYGDELSDALANSDSTAFILLIEANPAYFKKLLQSRDISKEISDPRVSVSVGEKPVMAVMGRMESEFKIFTRSNFQVIRNRLSYRCEPVYYKAIDQNLELQKKMGEGNLLTMGKLSGLWQENVLKNIPYLLKSPGIKELFGTMKGIPALIVSAGPSLDKNCRWIRMAKESMVVISVDTALKTLLKNGVTPHFVVALDALVENWEHIEGIEKKGYTLIVNPVTYPLIVSGHSDNLMITSYSDPLVEWLEKFTGSLGLNLTGGSVATSAFDFADRIGCSPIILTGQDLAFTGGRTHSSGGSRDESAYVSSGSPESMENLHGFEIDQEIFEKTAGNLGHTLSSSLKMNAWKNWFEMQIEGRSINCINATEGGALIKGAKVSTLQEAISSFGGGSPDIVGIINKATNVSRQGLAEEISKSLANLAEVSKEIKKICSLGLRAAQELQQFSLRKNADLDSQDKKLKECAGFFRMIMSETEFVEINHWRLEKTMDSLQRMYSSVKSEDRREQLYINSETCLIFFRDLYGITRKFEKSVKGALIQLKNNSVGNEAIRSANVV